MKHISQNKKNIGTWKLLFVFCLEFVFWNLKFTQTVNAQSALGLSAIPPRLELTVKPGEVVTKEIKIRNESKNVRSITVSARDFIVTDDAGTPIQIEGDSTQNRWASSNWISVSPSSFRLDPGETKSLMLTVIAPEEALPGGHYAMVLHSPKNEAVLNDTGSVIQTNVGTLVYITVPGDITEKALVKDFTAPKFSEYGPVDFKTNITNLSDIHIAPIGSVDIKNLFGGRTASLPLSNTNIFPQTSREFTNTLARKWLFGRYAATLNAGYGTTGQALTATIFFWVIPWRLITLALVALALIVTIFILVRQRQTPPPESTDTQVEELEKELAKLKQKYKDR
ncbi:hypothetical protein KBC75_01615 [Candidatus Shapirobacteria bacterium]|nr:hypothetical protein [Candidatus Shapirobacteria bacterium]